MSSTKRLVKSLAAPFGILSFITLFYIIANRCGLGYTYDSHLYIDIAHQISKKGLWLSEGLKIKPPLYPLLVNLFGEANLIFVNLALLLVSVAILTILSDKLKYQKLKWAYWLSIVFSTPMLLVHSFVWTEPLFMTLLLAMFYLLIKYESDQNPKTLLLAVILLFSLPFIRFAGLFILIPVLIYLISKSNSLQRKWLILIMICGFTLFIYWVSSFEQGFLQRWSVLISPFVKGDFTRYIDNSDSYLEALSIWIMPLTIYKPLRIVIAGLAVMTLIYMAIRSFRKHNGVLQGGLFFIFVIYYFSLQTVFHVAYYSAERYLTPFYHLLILAILLMAEGYLRHMKVNLKRVIYGLLILWLLYGAARTVKNVFFWNQIRCENAC